MLGSKKKKKKVQGLSRNYGTFTFPDHCTSSHAPFSALSHIWWQCAMPMIFVICPGCFWTSQALTVGADEMICMVYVTDG